MERSSANRCTPSLAQEALHQNQWKSIPAEPIRNLAEELLANRNLLASLAGPTVALTVDVQGGALPVRMTSEDLTRILVNLARNAAEAMSGVGRIHISLRESSGEPNNSPWVTVNVEDNGPGLAGPILEKIFEPGTVVTAGRSDDRGMADGPSRTRAFDYALDCGGRRGHDPRGEPRSGGRLLPDRTAGSGLMRRRLQRFEIA